MVIGSGKKYSHCVYVNIKLFLFAPAEIKRQKHCSISNTIAEYTSPKRYLSILIIRI